DRGGGVEIVEQACRVREIEATGIQLAGEDLSNGALNRFDSEAGVVACDDREAGLVLIDRQVVVNLPALYCLRNLDLAEVAGRQREHRASSTRRKAINERRDQAAAEADRTRRRPRVHVPEDRASERRCVACGWPSLAETVDVIHHDRVA